MIIKEKIIYGKVDFYESKKGFGHESHSFLDSYKYIIQLDRWVFFNIYYIISCNNFEFYKDDRNN